MSFPIQEEIKELEEANPVFVDYVITANGWRASGCIKCRNERDKQFWSLLEMVVNNIIRGKQEGVLNESYTDGFSRYLRPVKRDDFTLRWVEMNYQSSNQKVIK